MGDMEDYEIRCLRRDAQLDGYDDWLQGFSEKDEPRITLLSWLWFQWHCVRCDDTVWVIKRGDHSYEADCDHVFDRQGVDLSRAADEKRAEYDRAMWQSELYDCPYHLVKVSIVDWHQNWWNDGETLVLACNCKIAVVPERRVCPSCPPLIDGTPVAPRVVKRATVAERSDPTVAYLLECGHSTIDL